MRKLGTDEWNVCLVYGMYANTLAYSRVRAGDEYTCQHFIRFDTVYTSIAAVGGNSGVLWLR